MQLFLEFCSECPFLLDDSSDLLLVPEASIADDWPGRRVSASRLDGIDYLLDFAGDWCVNRLMGWDAQNLWSGD